MTDKERNSLQLVPGWKGFPSRASRQPRSDSGRDSYVRPEHVCARVLDTGCLEEQADKRPGVNAPSSHHYLYNIRLRPHLTSLLYALMPLCRGLPAALIWREGRLISGEEDGFTGRRAYKNRSYALSENRHIITYA